MESYLCEKENPSVGKKPVGLSTKHDLTHWVQDNMDETLQMTFF